MINSEKKNIENIVKYEFYDKSASYLYKQKALIGHEIWSSFRRFGAKKSTYWAWSMVLFWRFGAKKVLIGHAIWSFFNALDRSNFVFGRQWMFSRSPACRHIYCLSTKILSNGDKKNLLFILRDRPKIFNPKYNLFHIYLLKISHFEILPYFEDCFHALYLGFRFLFLRNCVALLLSTHYSTFSIFSKPRGFNKALESKWTPYILLCFIWTVEKSASLYFIG